MKALELSHKIKAAQGRINSTEAELEEKLRGLREAQQSYDDLKKKLQALKQELKSLTAVEKESILNPIVSEHAIIRYLERICGLNLDDVISNILTESVRRDIKDFGSGKFPIKAGFNAVVKKGIVTTVE